MLVVPGRDGAPVTLLPLALTTVPEDEAGVFDFQLQQLNTSTWRLCLGPGVADDPALRQRCRSVLADFVAAQGGAKLRILTRAVAALPLGHSGKLMRIVARPVARPPAPT